ncbi:MAG: hypothetical protein ACJ8G8_21365 [Pseudomonas sp.]
MPCAPSCCARCPVLARCRRWALTQGKEWRVARSRDLLNFQGRAA